MITSFSSLHQLLNTSPCDPTYYSADRGLGHVELSCQGCLRYSTCCVAASNFSNYVRSQYSRSVPDSKIKGAVADLVSAIVILSCAPLCVRTVPARGHMTWTMKGSQVRSSWRTPASFTGQPVNQLFPATKPNQPIPFPIVAVRPNTTIGGEQVDVCIKVSQNLAVVGSSTQRVAFMGPCSLIVGRAPAAGQCLYRVRAGRDRTDRSRIRHVAPSQRPGTGLFAQRRSHLLYGMMQS